MEGEGSMACMLSIYYRTRFVEMFYNNPRSFSIALQYDLKTQWYLSSCYDTSMGCLPHSRHGEHQGTGSMANIT